MRKIKLITDSTADMLKEDYLKYDLDVVPLYIILDGKEISSVDITSKELFAYAKAKKVLPKTSTISVETMKNYFSKYLEQDYDVVFICLSKEVSGTYNSARIAVEELGTDRVHLVSSQGVSTATALLVEYAVRLKEAGENAKRIAEILNKTAPKTTCQFIVDTLEYLYLGGRVSALGRFLGQTLRIHPYLKAIDGKLTVYKKPIGKLSKCYMELVEEFKKDLPTMDLHVVYLTHCLGEPEDIEMIRSELVKYIDPSIIKITEAGSVISTHCGPRTIGILYINN